MLNQYEPSQNIRGDLEDLALEAAFLNKLPSHRLLQLTLAGTVTEFCGHSLILAEGSVIEEVYLIQRGLVTVSLYSEINPAKWLYRCGPGMLVDMCALLEPPISPVSIYALTDVKALAIPRATFVEVLREESKLGFEMLRHLCGRLSLITRIAVKEFSQDNPGPSLN